MCADYSSLQCHVRILSHYIDKINSGPDSDWWSNIQYWFLEVALVMKRKIIGVPCKRCPCFVHPSLRRKTKRQIIRHLLLFRCLHQSSSSSHCARVSKRRWQTKTHACLPASDASLASWHSLRRLHHLPAYPKSLPTFINLIDQLQQHEDGEMNYTSPPCQESLPFDGS